MAYYFASALEAVILDRKRHTREAARLRSLASTITTAAMKARVLEQAQEHARLAGIIGASEMVEGVQDQV